MADNWYLFGIHLGLSEDTLKVIDKLKIKNSTRCLVMFQQWMEEIGPVENKMDKIEQAMKEVMKVKRVIVRTTGSPNGEICQMYSPMSTYRNTLQLLSPTYLHR